MTDEALALVRPIIGIEYRTPQEVFDIMCDRFAYRNAIFETQAREIERLRGALGEIMERGGAFGGIWCALAAQEALAEGTKP